jgi:hypothetical protein
MPNGKLQPKSTREHLLDYDQAILEYYTGTPESGWLHVSYNKDGNRKQRLKAFRNDAGKTQYEEI